MPEAVATEALTAEPPGDHDDSFLLDASLRNFLIDAAWDELLRIVEWQIEDLAIAQLSSRCLHGKISASP